jgi:hypothetical protein
VVRYPRSAGRVRSPRSIYLLRLQFLFSLLTFLLKENWQQGGLQFYIDISSLLILTFILTKRWLHDGCKVVR